MLPSKFEISIRYLSEFARGVSQNGGDPAGIVLGIDEGVSFDTIVALSRSGKWFGFLAADLFGVAITGKPRGEHRATRRRRLRAE
jgi:hypothetical protein